MSRVLLLVTTTSYRARAFLDAARADGVELVVGTDREQALAALNPRAHLTLEFGDPDAAIAAARRAHEAAPFAAIIAADDDGAVLAARIAAALGLRHAAPEAVAQARDKRRAREAFRRAGLPSPPFSRVPVDADPFAAAAVAPYPCVIKPPSLSASRGVLRANDAAEFVSAFRRVAAIAGPEAGELLVEGFLPGREVAVEGLLADGALRVLAIFDKPDPLDGPTFEETLYVTPSRLADADRDVVTRRAADMARALGLTEGAVHAELRVHAGEAWPLEIAPRSIGGLCSLTLRFGAGRSLETLLLRQALGGDVSALERERRASGVMMLPIPRAGTLADVRGLDAARAVPGIEDVRITIPKGQRVVPLPKGDRYLGFVFARADAADAVETALREAHRCLQFDIVATP
jgi:biotin carboxylase